MRRLPGSFKSRKERFLIGQSTFFSLFLSSLFTSFCCFSFSLPFFNLFFSHSHSLFSNILFPLPSFPASRLSPPPPPPHSANICGVQCKPPGGALGMHSAPWLARDVQPSGRWPCEQPPCRVMRVVGEGCARGRGDVGEAPRSLCWGVGYYQKKSTCRGIITVWRVWYFAFSPTILLFSTIVCF